MTIQIEAMKMMVEAIANINQRAANGMTGEVFHNLADALAAGRAAIEAAEKVEPVAETCAAFTPRAAAEIGKAMP